MIPFTKYIDVKTVYKSTPSNKRLYHLRLFSQSDYLPTNTLLQFYSATEVSDFFGTTSEEFQRAKIYFSYVSEKGKTAEQLEMFKYSPFGASPTIFGNIITNQNIIDLQAITAGELTLKIGAVTKAVTGLDFSAVTKLDDIADILQIGITPTVATVSVHEFRKSIIIKSVTTEKVDLLTITSPTTGLLLNLGFIEPTLSLGSATETIIECIESSMSVDGDATDNFGSIVVQDALPSEIVDVAIYNNTLSSSYLFSAGLPSEDYLTSTEYDQIMAVEGTCLVFDDTEQGTEVCPCAIFCATDYTQADGVLKYMYASFPSATPVVGKDRYLAFDAKKINYIGSTGKNGARFTFFQDGYISGKAGYLEVYTGGVFVSQSLQSSLFDILSSGGLLPLGIEGEALILTTIRAKALEYTTAGIISPDRALTSEQTLAVIQDYGIEVLASINDNGFYASATTNGTTIEYLLVYKSVVGVRKIEGTHTILGV